MATDVVNVHCEPHAGSALDQRDRFGKSANGAAVWGKVREIDGSDGSWERFEYDPETGWVTADITPFQNSGPGDANSASRVTVYAYDNAGMGGTMAVPTALTERPRSATDSVQGHAVSKTLYQYGAGSSGIAGRTVMRQLASLTGGWNDTENLQTVIQPQAYGLSNVWSPSGSQVYASPNLDPSTGRLEYDADVAGPSGMVYQRVHQTLSPHGTALESQTWDFAGRSSIYCYPSTEIADTATEVDAFGRATKTTDNLTKSTANPNGLSTTNDFNPSAANQAYWLGPTTVTATDGVISTLAYTAWGNILTASALGIASAFAYDAAGNMTSTRQTAGGITRAASAVFDVLGRQKRGTDEIGRVTDTAYAAAAGGGAEATTTCSDGSTAISDYYRDGSLASLSGTAEVPVQYSSGVGIPTTDPDYAGDANSASVFWTQTLSNDGKNRQRTYYDSLGRPQRSTQSGIVASARVFYNGSSQVARTVGFDGAQTLYEYDARGGVSSTALDVNKNGLINKGTDRVTEVNTVTTTHPDATATHDAVTVFQTTTTIVGDGTTPSYRTIDEQSVDGKRTWHGEQVQRGTTWTNVAGTASWSVYAPGTEPGNGVLTATNGDGTRNTTTYIAREARSEQQLGTDLQPVISVASGYDAFGDVQTSTDAFGTTTVLRRADGSVWKTTLSDGRTVVSDPVDKYDTAKATTRPDGTTVSTPTNPLGQVASVSGAGTAPMTFGINPLTGQQTSLTTFTGSTFNSGTAAETSWKFDDATGRLLSKSYAGTASGASDIAYGYGTDNKDALLHTITRPGSIETLAYNDGSDSTPVTGEVRSASFQNNGTLESAYTFVRDIFGRLSSVQQTAGGTQTVDYAYTADGQLQSESQPWAGAYMATTYGYYATTGTTGPANALENVSLKDGDNTVVGQTYTYNPQTQRLETVSGAGLTDTYEYRPNTDLVASLTSSNNITTSYQYERNTGRLQSIASYCGTTTVYGISYEYNANDQRQSATETRLLPDDTTETRTYRFEYDAQDHLTVYEVKDASGTVIADRSFTYSYDALGNRTDTGYSVNALNQYTAVPNGGTISYDGRGNLTGIFGLCMTYDSQDRLIQVVNGTVTAKYGYDYMGRRTSKALYVTGQSQPYETRTFAYDGWNLIAEFVQDATHTTPTLARSYTWGIGLAGSVGALLSVTDHLAVGGAQTYVPIFDGNGNVMELADSTGAVVATYTYDPYGKLLSATGSAADACPFRFATMYFDGESGFYYGKVRYVFPAIQQWLTRDPAEEDGGVNLNAYCGGDPVNKVDPTGLQAALGRMDDDTYQKELDIVARDQEDMGDALAKEVLRRLTDTMAEQGMKEVPAHLWYNTTIHRALDTLLGTSGSPEHTLEVLVLVRMQYGERSSVTSALNLTDAGAVFQYHQSVHGRDRTGAEVRRSRGFAMMGQGLLMIAAAKVGSPAGARSPGRLTSLEEMILARKSVTSPTLAPATADLDQLAANLKAAVENTGPRTLLKNGHLAGTVHPKSGIPYNLDGFAMFDSLAEVELPARLQGPTVSDTTQMTYATRQLRDVWLKFPGVADTFTPEQLVAIRAGEPRIPGLIWDHPSDGATLRLVDANLHLKTGHSGGRQMTGGRR